MDICQLIRKRKSCRSFTDQPVSLETVRTILGTARWAPSGVNHQPAKVAVLGQETKARLSQELIRKFLSGDPPHPDYEFCPPTWPDIYQLRRKACGRALYDSLKISNDDIEGKKSHKSRNYNFFDAPIGFIITIEKGMPKGSWVDVGMFIQNILLAAEGLGLATCPQASLAEYPDVVREILSLENVDVVCGIAIGYENPSHPLNSYRTERELVDSFTQWYS